MKKTINTIDLHKRQSIWLRNYRISDHLKLQKWLFYNRKRNEIEWRV